MTIPVPRTEHEPLAQEALRARLLAPTGPLARVDVVAETGSTNDAVLAALRTEPDAWPDVSLLVADHQTGGHGRAGRTWVTPAGTSVTCTFTIRTHVAPTNFGWFPLLAGLAAVRALRAAAGVEAVLKWPNDVLLPAADAVEGWGRTRKVGGVLCQVVPARPGAALRGGAEVVEGYPAAGSTILLGIGLNVLQQAADLPVESATSVLASTGRAVPREDVVVALANALVDILDEWRAAHRDPLRSALPAEVAAVCATLGTRVRVELPGAAHVDGLAERIASDGSLVVTDDSGARHTVLAGDVRHVRTPR